MHAESTARVDMGLNGDLSTMPLPDVLQWLAAGRKSGTLHVERLSARRRLMLRDGNVRSSWSNDPRESLGRHLVRLRLITEEQLFEALLVQEAEGRLLGPILVEQGILGEEELRRVVAAKAEETLYELFQWTSGRFEFREGELPDSAIVEIDTPVTPVILESVRRLDEWGRIQDVIPTMDATLEPSAPLPNDATNAERLMMVFAAQGSTLAEMAQDLGHSEFDTAALAFALVARGHLTVRDVRFPDETSDPIEAVQALLTAANQMLAQRSFDSAQKVFEEILSIDRLNQHAKKGLLVIELTRCREIKRDAIPRDGVPELAVDLATLTRQNLDPHEGFVLSRVNGGGDVQSILQLCPMSEDETLDIFARLLERGLIRFS